MSSQSKQQQVAIFPEAQVQAPRKRNVNIEACRQGGRTRAAQASFKDACKAGGKARAQQESFVEACSKGFAVTCERHPWMALILQKDITARNQRNGQVLGMSASAYREQRLQETGHTNGFPVPEDFL